MFLLSKEILEKIVKEVSRLRILTPEHVIELINEFNEEGIKALEMLEPNRAFKVKFNGNEVEGFSGESGDYIIFDEVGFCGCMSRYPANIVKRRYCPHIIAFKILKALGKFSIIEYPENKLDWVMKYLKFNIED